MTQEYVETRVELTITPTGGDGAQAACVAVTIIAPSGGKMDVPFDTDKLIKAMTPILFAEVGDAFMTARINSEMILRPFGRVFLYCKRCGTSQRLDPAHFKGRMPTNRTVTCWGCVRPFALHYRSDLGGDVLMETEATYATVYGLLGIAPDTETTP